MLLLIIFLCSAFTTLKNSNTSHVTINRAVIPPELRNIRHSNTSHVTINPAFPFLYKSTLHIQIHLMLLLITVLSFPPDMLTNSNTSHVTINPAVVMKLHTAKKFKYISCYY